MLLFKNKFSGRVISKKELFSLLKVIGNDREADIEYYSYIPIRRAFSNKY